MWEIIDAHKANAGIETMEATMESILGITGRDKLSLTLNAEIIKRLVSLAGKVYCPNTLVKAALKTVLMNDPRGSKLRGTFEDDGPA